MAHGTWHPSACFYSPQLEKKKRLAWLTLPDPPPPPPPPPAPAHTRVFKVCPPQKAHQPGAALAAPRLADLRRPDSAHHSRGPNEARRSPLLLLASAARWAQPPILSSLCVGPLSPLAWLGTRGVGGWWVGPVLNAMSIPLRFSSNRRLQAPRPTTQTAGAALSSSTWCLLSWPDAQWTTG